MNQNLKEYLKNDEAILWESQPANFPAIDGSTKKSYFARAIGAVVVAGGIVAGHLASAGQTRMGVIILVLGAAACVLLAPFWQKNRLMKHKYWITNQRIIMIGSDGIPKSMLLAEIDAYKVVSDGAAKNCLVLGSIVFQDAEKQIRWRAATPKVEEEAGGHKDHALGMVLYNPENTDKAIALLKQAGCPEVA